MSDLPRRIVFCSQLLALCLGLSACAGTDSARQRLLQSVQPYRIDVVQGNLVTRERLDLVKPGVSRIQVRDVLGSPLLTSVFHANRWDYVFTLQSKGLAPQARRVTVFFKDDVVERVEADSVPTEAEFAEALGNTPGAVTPRAPVLQATPQELDKRAPAVRPRAPETPTDQAMPPLPSSYPPLEPASRR